MPEYYVCNKRDVHNGWMDGCIVWWRAGGHGYTYDLNQAGVFTDADRANHYPPENSGCIYVPKEIVDANSYSPRLAYWSRARTADTKALCELVDCRRR